MSTAVTPRVKTAAVTPVEFTEMPPDRRVRFSVEQYEQLLRAGFLVEGSPIELLDGQLHWKDRRDSGSPHTTIGRREATAVTVPDSWLIEVGKGHGCFSFCQQPLGSASSDAPEPDASLLRGTLEEFHDDPDAVLLVAEVADSSLDLRRFSTRVAASVAAESASGIVFDAFIVQAALKSRADRLPPLNPQHVLRLGPHHSSEVIRPLTTQVP
jgi:hypothetical protein